MGEGIDSVRAKIQLEIELQELFHQ